MRDAILNRVSTRTFVKENLTIEHIAQIESVLKKYKTVKGPFGHSFDFTFSLNDTVDGKGQKIGTYGLLKNVPAFIGGVCENTVEGIVDFGYVFEHIILELTNIGFATCWLGGTFRRNQYRKKLEENQIIPAISPVGHRAEKRSPIDRLLRTAAQSNNRLEDHKMFFDYETEEPLNGNHDVIIKQSVCLVRRGPSASNKQPWRLFVEGTKVHFYIERNKTYAKALSYDMQALDIGIALAHYDIGVQYFNKDLTYKKYDVKDLDNKTYIVTAEF